MYPGKCTQRPSVEGIAVYLSPNKVLMAALLGPLESTGLPDPYDFCSIASRNRRTIKVTTSLASSSLEGFEGASHRRDA